MSTPEITPYESGRGIVDSWLDELASVKFAEDLPAFLPQMGLGEDLTVPFEADKFVSYLRDLSASSVERQRDFEQLFQGPRHCSEAVSTRRLCTFSAGSTAQRKQKGHSPGLACSRPGSVISMTVKIWLAQAF